MLQMQSSSSLEIDSRLIARCKGIWVQNAGKLEFPPSFRNEMFVADGIWQREKGKKPENPNA